MLTISGKHEEATETKDKQFVRRERRYGAFSRTMALPEGVDPRRSRRPPTTACWSHDPAARDGRSGARDHQGHRGEAPMPRRATAPTPSRRPALRLRIYARGPAHAEPAVCSDRRSAGVILRRGSSMPVIRLAKASTFSCHLLSAEALSRPVIRTLSSVTRRRPLALEDLVHDRPDALPSSQLLLV